MGEADKTLLDVDGRPMLARILAVLDTPIVAISANGNPSRFAAFRVPVLPDGVFHDQGPLAGLLAGLDWAADRGVPALLTVPGDTPFLPPGLIRQLHPAPAAAASGGQRHHLVALWPVDCRVRLREVLSRPGPRRVADFAAMIQMRYVDFPVRNPDLFANVNTRDELARARATVAQSIMASTTRQEQGHG